MAVLTVFLAEMLAVGQLTSSFLMPYTYAIQKSAKLMCLIKVGVIMQI